MAIVHDLNHFATPQHALLRSLQIGQPASGKYSVRVELTLKGKDIAADMDGDKPLDAVFRAINKASGCSPRLTNFEAHSISHGCDAQAEAIITLEQDGKMYTGHARDTDTIMATARSYVSGISKILAQKG
jgi:2-isopropylmalate synthase